DGKRIPGVRKLKGQKETRRLLVKNVVPVLGHRTASEVTRKEIVELANSVVARGANVLAGSMVRELSLAYEYAIGLGRFDDDFANP
ncbi:phage integrase central domain-containing protein, partial [Enterobacter hormaechei]